MKQTNLFDLPDLIQNGNQKSFYNTIHLHAAELKQFKADAKGQEKIILKVFEGCEKLTPLEVERRTGINHDSCKRAITNLTTQNKLIKLGKEDMILEAKGKMNHRWHIK